MNYPYWSLPFSGGLLIAVIAVLHVFVAHYAVGGGLFLVLAERLAARAPGAAAQAAVVEYVRRHAKIFLLTSMVFGGLSGVAIWLVISVISPEATSLLVHEFAFAWATEWAFFLGEIVALLVYFYGFDKLTPGERQGMGLVYFLFAFLSLFMINGVITFMLTPGDWPVTRDFWDGFFNPSFWPALILRTALSLSLAGLFGLAIATRTRDEAARRLLVRYAALFAALPLVPLAAAALWHLRVLPEAQQALILRHTQDIRPFMQGFLLVVPAIFAGGLLFALAAPRRLGLPLSLVLLLLGLGLIGTFEWMRETGRRPFVLQDLIYSTGLRADCMQAECLPAAPPGSEDSFLARARWTEIRSAAEDPALAGRRLYAMQCANCHGLTSPMLSMRGRADRLTTTGLEAQLAGQGRRRTFMPPFIGNAQERQALAAYIAEAVRQERQPDRR